MLQCYGMIDLSIVIPCYNEGQRLPGTLWNIYGFLARTDMNAEVLVIDDGSTDDTVYRARAMAMHMPQLRVRSLGQNYGKGRAVQYGMLTAAGRYVLFMDADNATSIDEVNKLMPHTTLHDVVIGSRHAPGSDIVVRQPWYRRFIGRVGNGLIRLLLVQHIRDTQCGFKLFKSHAAKDIFSRLRTKGFGFDIEVLAIAQRLGYRVKEVGVSWYDAAESTFRPVHDTWCTLKEMLRIAYYRPTWRKRTPITAQQTLYDKPRRAF